MKLLKPILWFLFAAVLPVSAQVTVEVVPDQDQFLPGEALPVAVRIINHSGQTLHFGDDPDWLTFAVESRDGLIVVKTGEVPVLGQFTLESSKKATKRVDLAPYFNLTRPGCYSIIATVHIKEWDGQVASAPKAFDIIEGAKLWSQEFGIPTGVTNQSPEVRKYILQQANYLKTQLKLYLRLTDVSESKVIKVFPIGPMVSFGRPEPQLDKFNNLHVLYQDGARQFSYTVINPDGDVIIRQTYDYVNARPRLQMGEDGKLTVIGGVRRMTADDVPSPKAPTNEIQRPKL